MKIFLPAIIVVLFSCNPVSTTRIPKPEANTRTFVPIYMSATKARQVEYLPARSIVHSGKIYTIGNYLLQVEKDSGIHVINYANRTAPQKVGFIRSLYCSEMAIKGNFLYINNFNDLVIMNISDLNNPVEVKRIINAFPLIENDLPPMQGSFFECPDPAKGLVVGWKDDIRDYPKCYR